MAAKIFSASTLQQKASRSISSLGGSFIVSYGGNMTFAEKTVISATIGGTAEALGGGKFANGAVTGAYVMMLNHLGDHGDDNNKEQFDPNWQPPTKLNLSKTGDIASYGSGAIGLTQIGMMEYRMSLPIMSKIGTFSSFASRYGTLGKFGGRLSYAGAGISLISNISKVRSGEIGLGRFSYRLGSLGASIVTGAAIGGPWGAVGGAAVGGISVGVEYIYDNMLVPLGNEIQYQIWNFENAIKNGWYPGR